jgi:hypothetical protein
MTIVLYVLYAAILVLVVVGYWQTFTKAGEPGWAALIPIYNLYVLLRIVGRPGWWLVLYLIPFVELVVALVVSLDLATSFRRGTGFGIGIWLLPWLFVPMLGLGTYEYAGPGALGPGQSLIGR